MTDDKPRPDDETQPVRPEGATTLPPPPPPPAPAPEPVAGPGAPAATTADPVQAAPATASPRGFGARFRSLRGSNGSGTFGLAALIASALAGIIVGGLGFAAAHAIGDDRGRDRGRDRGGWMQQRYADDRGPGRDGLHGGPHGVPGQLPPAPPPEDDDSSTS